SSMNCFQLDHVSVSVSPNQNRFVSDYKHNHDYMNPHQLLPLTNSHIPNHSTTPSPGWSSDGDSPSGSEYTVIKYISDMLMEEDLENKPCMLQESLALQAAEKSFYDVLVQKNPPSIHLSPSSVDSGNSDTTANELISSYLNSDQFEFKSPHTQTSSFDPPENTLAESQLYGILQHLGQLEGGIGEASKFLPHEAGDAEWSYQSSNGLRGRKNHQREDSDYLEQGRSNKHSASSLTEWQELDMFDEVLLSKSGRDEPLSCPVHELARKKAIEKSQQKGQLKGSNGRSMRAKKQGGSEGEVVDLPYLLTQCAQAVSSSDQRVANELLKQIRQHSSPFGDGTQRMAHYFAKALEVRLNGISTPLHYPFVSSTTSAADLLKAYQLYISACPFRRMSNFFTNRTIMKLAEQETRIHIIDFGILYGFQWPCFIQKISKRPGGPPKIRITGIEFPQPGFRPAERVEDTGRRLKRYCERFNVPFEYKAIAQRWDTIRLEDLKIDRKEMTVVTCLYRLINLPDDTVVINSPRDAVLKLIKRINPDLFVHGVVNGTFNAPFFVTRFREALFHFSALYDIFEATTPREDKERLMYETENIGRDVMNVIACEGLERMERPETYKQWQARNLRVGFRHLPLDQDILSKVKTSVKSEYHEDFVIDEDGNWMLQGWKGRVINALSCWKPVQDQE
ncbi:GRAS domain-containing protein, partial [Cephalotus follicularis]